MGRANCNGVSRPKQAKSRTHTDLRRYWSRPAWTRALVATELTGGRAIKSIYWRELLTPTTMDDIAPLRILDAAANRASEGLRVIEDYLRFALDDPHLTNLCKQLRHDLAEALRHLPSPQRHAARDTQADVGTEIAGHTEFQRFDATAVVAAGFKRVEQALRSLEEYGKLIAVDFAAAIEQLRYRTYTLERAADLTRANAESLSDARLYVLIDGRSSLDEFAQLVQSLVEARVDCLQLRDKTLVDRGLIARARCLRKLTRGTKTLAVINDRADIARLVDADGVHVGQDELSVKDARTVVGPRALVGVSTHSIEQARAAVLDGANYIGVGPTFPSTTKHFDLLAGLGLLRAVAAEIRLPAFAIGGVTLENLDEVLASGIKRVAVSAAIAHAGDPADIARQFVQRLARDR
jgi:thiamine-phosphate pyrophosphorylase